MSKLQVAREVAMGYRGMPYIWGGDDPIKGFDCSGFCIEILKSVGLLPRSGDWTAAGLFEKFESSPQGFEGCLVYYRSSRNNRIIHVEYCLGDGLAIGASGGGSSTTNAEIASSKNAYIKIRPFESRSNMAGFNDPFAELR